MILFNGKEEALKLDQKILETLRRNPSLAKPDYKLCLILVGSEPSSVKFVNLKKQLCERLGIYASIELINENDSDKEIVTRVRNLCNDPGVKGVVIQLPLPRPSLETLPRLIPEQKDVDQISPVTNKKLRAAAKLSPVIRAFNHFLDYAKLNPKNLETTIIGKGFLVGEPLGYYLLQQGAKVQYVLDYKANAPLNCQLLVLSAGYPRLVRGEYIQEKCNVVDFGSSVINNKTIGDLDLNSTIGHLNWVSPSPGGMGPLVTRYLVMNFLGI